MSIRSRAARFVAVLAVAAIAPSIAGAQAAAPTALKVGEMAPDFTVKVVTAAGVVAKPFKLSEHKGETVVLAFFPKARTSGCTAQMHTYRDKYDSMFLNGSKVRLIGISTDNAADLTAWAKDDGFQFAMGADSDKKVGALFNASTEAGYHKRFLYVIGPDGKIAYATNFRAMAQDAYDDLDAAIKKVAR
jgi:peroxiredoxin Q/BCP